MADRSDGSEDFDLLSGLVAAARADGADAADALLMRGISLSQSCRHGETELLQREESLDLGLRVIVGAKQAVVSTTDLTAPALAEVSQRALAMARAVPDDPHCGLADPDQLCRQFPDLDTEDPVEPEQGQLGDRALTCEAAALAVEGITNSSGAGAEWTRDELVLVGSNGFAGRRVLTMHSFGVSVIAGEGLGMQSDYDMSSSVHDEDIEDPGIVGTRAGERSVKRLNPRKVATAQVPVVFDARVSASLVRYFAGAISGAAVARGTSFLKDRMGDKIFADGVRIIDDPARPRGLRSKAFDAEGLATSRRALIDDGVLTGWLLDLATAHQLGLASTGNASRGTSGPPSPAATNLYMEAGTQTPAALIGDIDQGFFVTETIGHGVNGVTGDYSMGAAGFWIEKGEIAYPVTELTIAANLVDMYRTLTPADDLEFRHAVNAPSLRVEGMTVAGEGG